MTIIRVCLSSWLAMRVPSHRILFWMASKTGRINQLFADKSAATLALSTFNPVRVNSD